MSYWSKDCLYIAKKFRLRPDRCCGQCHRDGEIYEVKLLGRDKLYNLCCRTLGAVPDGKFDWDWDPPDEVCIGDPQILDTDEDW